MNEVGRTLGRVWRLALGPALLYLAGFVVLTWPLAASFSMRFFADDGDGLESVWNLWWFDHAVRELGASPFRTDLLHFPHGITLAGHTLSPWCGLRALPLLRFLTLVETHNAVVVASFVAAGVTAFWLALDVTRSPAPSLAAGWLFTFSSYHFAHLEGHLNLVAIEWLPVFLLAFRRLMDTPGVALAVASAAALAFVALSDFYYLLQAVVAGAVLVVARALELGAARPLVRPLAVFAALAIVAVGPLVAPLWLLARSERLTGGHGADSFPLDALGLVVPGGHWRFAALTETVWSRFRGNVHESSVALGLGVLALVAIAWRRRAGDAPETRRWLAVAAVAFVLALGPRLVIAGAEVPVLRLPYRWLEAVSPSLRVSGAPVRFVALAGLAAAVLAALALRSLVAGNERRVAAALVALAVLETLPRAPTSTAPDVPAWVMRLAELPPGAVADGVSERRRALYHQTVHRKPLATGKLARLPASAAAHEARVRALLESGDLAALARETGVRWVVLPAGGPVAGAVVFEDGAARIVELGTR